MATNQNNKIFFFYLHLKRESVNLSELNKYLTLEFIKKAFSESLNLGQPQRITLPKDKSDRFDKVLSKELRSFKRDILALMKQLYWTKK